jgi:hypothetical protein
MPLTNSFQRRKDSEVIEIAGFSASKGIFVSPTILIPPRREAHTVCSNTGYIRPSKPLTFTIPILFQPEQSKHSHYHHTSPWTLAGHR